MFHFDYGPGTLWVGFSTYRNENSGPFYDCGVFSFDRYSDGWALYFWKWSLRYINRVHL